MLKAGKHREQLLKDKGVNLQGLAMLNLEKTEENTLYIIELEKIINQQNSKFDKQEKTIQQQAEIIEELKKEQEKQRKILKNLLKK